MIDGKKLNKKQLKDYEISKVLVLRKDVMKVKQRIKQLKGEKDDE